MASARHLWAECPRYDDYRAVLQAQFNIDAGWWRAQPRVTAKSGWITYDAATSTDGRVKKLIAANKLGVRIVEDCWSANANSERRSVAHRHH